MLAVGGPQLLPTPVWAFLGLEERLGILQRSLGAWQPQFPAGAGGGAGNHSGPVSGAAFSHGGAQAAPQRAGTEWKQGRGCAGATAGVIAGADCAGAQQDTQDVLWGVVWGHLSLRWLRVDISPPKPQGILGWAGPHWVVVNYPPVFLLDMSKAGGDTAGPAALFTSAMLLSRTLCSFLKGRIWQDRKGEMQIFSFSFVFFFFS